MVFKSNGMENGLICDYFKEETAVDIDICSEDFPVHACASALTSNEETTNKTIVCIAIFHLDTVQNVVPTLNNKRGSP